jgi:uncharacterized protein YqfA (UPF0365 family)
MTLIIILNVVFATFVVAGIVGLLSAGILSDRTATVGLRARRVRPARARAARARLADSPM